MMSWCHVMEIPDKIDAHVDILIPGIESEEVEEINDAYKDILEELGNYKVCLRRRMSPSWKVWPPPQSTRWWRRCLPVAPSWSSTTSTPSASSPSTNTLSAPELASCLSPVHLQGRWDITGALLKTALTWNIKSKCWEMSEWVNNNVRHRSIHIFVIL